MLSPTIRTLAKHTIRFVMDTLPADRVAAVRRRWQQAWCAWRLAPTRWAHVAYLPHTAAWSVSSRVTAVSACVEWNHCRAGSIILASSPTMLPMCAMYLRHSIFLMRTTQMHVSMKTRWWRQLSRFVWRCLTRHHVPGSTPMCVVTMRARWASFRVQVTSLQNVRSIKQN